MPRSSRRSTSTNAANGSRPVSAAICAMVRPTTPSSSARVTPLISMVSHSATTPWQPSEPWTSRSSRIRASAAGSRSRASVASGPPADAQLGSIAESVVAPGRYG